MTGWTAADLTPQTGKRIVITGATGGLGFETALGLAGVGAEVLLTGRDPAKGESALSRIKATHPHARTEFALCDVASLASINAFADAQLAAGKPINVLINNAGVMAVPKRLETQDGFEMQFGTNVVGHFLLTSRLLPLLRAAPAPRTVQLASLAHKQGKIDIDDLNAQRSYRPWGRYQQSKLAMLMFAMELQRRGDERQWGITSLAAHPGLASTNLFRGGKEATLREKLQGKLIAPFCQSAAAGAWPILMAATLVDAEPGGYYGQPASSKPGARPGRRISSATPAMVRWHCACGTPWRLCQARSGPLSGLRLPQYGRAPCRRSNPQPPRSPLQD